MCSKNLHVQVFSTPVFYVTFTEVNVNPIIMLSIMLVYWSRRK